MVEYPKRTQLGCPLGVCYVYILCYNYCTLFDHAMGMCTYRHTYKIKITCVRTIVPTMFSLDAFRVTFWLHWVEINTIEVHLLGHPGYSVTGHL